MQAALGAARRGRLVRVTAGLAVTLLLGAGFVALQVVLWTGLWHAGLRIDGGTFASVFYALTVWGALHVLVGLFALAWLALRSRRGEHNPGRHVGLRLWTAYWHFVGVVWLVLYATVFVF
jgi:cytochrome c oxidase subunit III